MASRPLVVLAVVLAPALSGCLANDIWREPFVWREHLHVGQAPDAAQAFAAALEDLPRSGADSLRDGVVGPVEDLPDNVVFQNLREFLERQRPGAGRAVDDAIRVAVAGTSEGFVTLTGAAAAAYSAATGPLLDEPRPYRLEAPDRTTRLRYTLDVTLVQEAPENGTNPTPIGRLDLRVIDPRGAVRQSWDIDRTRQVRDQFVVGTFGDANEVREDLAGTWLFDVRAHGDGAWRLVVEAYEPELEEYRMWQFWRGDRRGTTSD